MFFKKATKIEKIFTIDLTLLSKRQIDGEDLVNFCGLLRKHEDFFSEYLDFSNQVLYKILKILESFLDKI